MCSGYELVHHEMFLGLLVSSDFWNFAQGWFFAFRTGGNSFLKTFNLTQLLLASRVNNLFQRFRFLLLKVNRPALVLKVVEVQNFLWVLKICQFRMFFVQIGDTLAGFYTCALNIRIRSIIVLIYRWFFRRLLSPQLLLDTSACRDSLAWQRLLIIVIKLRWCLLLVGFRGFSRLPELNRFFLPTFLSVSRSSKTIFLFLSWILAKVDSLLLRLFGYHQIRNLEFRRVVIEEFLWAELRLFWIRR